MDRTEDAANLIKVVSALKGKHKRFEYRPRLTLNQTFETLESSHSYTTYYWNSTLRLWSTTNYCVNLLVRASRTVDHRCRQKYNY